MLKVAESNKKYHGIAGKDLGVIEKNIINAEKGIISEWGDYVQYRGNGTAEIKLPHIVFFQEDGSKKIIYVFGYDDKARWQKVLGGQLGCLYVDEANIADIDFIREASIRCDYMCWTLNPDNPDLPIYSEYINHSRPLKEYESQYPAELLEQLNLEPKAGYTHWYFTFNDNIACTEEKKRQIIENAPPGTKLHKNKILGLRGKATGLIFNLQPENIKSEQWLSEEVKAGRIRFNKFSCGVDTAYSRLSDDVIAFVYLGFTTDRRVIQLDEEIYNNKDINPRLSPSDIPPLLEAFSNRNKDKWGFGRDIFIDNEDAGTISEAEKYRRQKGSIYYFIPAWKAMKVIDRITLERGWLAKGTFLILNHCKHSIKEYNTYSWKDDKDEPENGNDHTVNARQYAWLPHRFLIGDYHKDKE